MTETVSHDNSYKYFLLNRCWSYRLLFCCCSQESSIQLHQESLPVELVVAAFCLKKMNMNQYHLSGSWDVWSAGTSSLPFLDDCTRFSSSSVLSLLLSGQPAPEKRDWHPDWLCHRMWYGVSPEWQGWWWLVLACLSTPCSSIEVRSWCFSTNVALPSQSMRKYNESVLEVETCI